MAGTAASVQLKVESDFDMEYLEGLYSREPILDKSKLVGMKRS